MNNDSIFYAINNMILAVILIKIKMNQLPIEFLHRAYNWTSVKCYKKWRILSQCLGRFWALTILAIDMIENLVHNLSFRLNHWKFQVYKYYGLRGVMPAKCPFWKFQKRQNRKWRSLSIGSQSFMKIVQKLLNNKNRDKQSNNIKVFR